MSFLLWNDLILHSIPHTLFCSRRCPWVYFVLRDVFVSELPALSVCWVARLPLIKVNQAICQRSCPETSRLLLSAWLMSSSMPLSILAFSRRLLATWNYTDSQVRLFPCLVNIAWLTFCSSVVSNITISYPHVWLWVFTKYKNAEMFAALVQKKHRYPWFSYTAPLAASCMAFTLLMGVHTCVHCVWESSWDLLFYAAQWECGGILFGTARWQPSRPLSWGLWLCTAALCPPLTSWP